MANSVDPDQTTPIGAVCYGSTLFASILNSSVNLGNYWQQTTSADDIFRYIFLDALRVKYLAYCKTRPRGQVIKLFSCSTQLSTKFQLLIKTKMLKNTDFSWLRCCINLIINIKMPKIFNIYEQNKFRAQLI